MARDLWKLAIHQNYELLVDNMNADELLPYLYQHHVITMHQKEKIRVEKLRQNQCQLLIDYICRCNPQFNPYGHFVRALRDKEQNNLADSIERTYEILEQDPSEATSIIFPHENREDKSCSCQCESIPSRGYHRLTCRNCLSLYSIVLFVLTPFRYIRLLLKGIYQVLRPIPFHVFIYSKRLFVLTPLQYVRQMLMRVNLVLMQLFHFIALKTYDHVIEPLVSGSNSERLVYLLHLVGYNLSYIYVLFVILPLEAPLIYIIITLLIRTGRTSTCTHGQIPVTPASINNFFHISVFVLSLFGAVVTFPQISKNISMTHLPLTFLPIILIIMVISALTYLPIFSLSIMNICSLVYLGVEYGYFFNKSLYLSIYPLLHIVLCSILVSDIARSYHMYVSLRHFSSIFRGDGQNFLPVHERFYIYSVFLCIFIHIISHIPGSPKTLLLR